MAVCVIARDQNREIQEVYAPNKKPSILFRDAVKLVKDKEKALRTWATAYTKVFKENFGDWENAPTPDMNLDENGEPVITEVLQTESLDTPSDTKGAIGQEEQSPEQEPGQASNGFAEALSERMGIPFKYDSNLPTVGAFRDGTVIINPAKVAKDTMFHEFAHPFVEAIRQSNPKLFKNLADRAGKFMYKGISVYEFVKENNPELQEGTDEFNSEVIATAIGLEGAEPGTVSDNENRKKFVDWFKTILRKIAEYFNFLEEDPSVKISPEDLDINMGINQLALLLHMENEFDFSGVDLSGLEANQTATATAPGAQQSTQHYGSRESLDFFENLARNIELVEENDGTSYYTDGTIDPATGGRKKFGRLTDFTYGQFVPDKETGKGRTKKFDADEYLNRETEKLFKKENADLNDKISYGSNSEKQTFEQIKAALKIAFDGARVRGKIMHKMIEGFLKHSDPNYFQGDIDKLNQEGGLQGTELNWFDKSVIKSILSKTGLNTADFGDTNVEFRDNISSELMMTDDTFGIGTANDGMVEHSDKSVSFFDFKTGGRLLNDEHIQRRMVHTDGMTRPITDTRLNRAKLELVMRMVLAKMKKPDLAVRELKIVYISKNTGSHIRKIDVQNYLDYINNNYKITIRDLQKEISGGKLTGQELADAKELLEQKKKEFEGMQSAKVFDFHNYQTEAGYLHQEDDLALLSDPKEKLEWMKNKTANESRKSITLNKEVTKGALSAIKRPLVGILNHFKADNITDVESSGTEDISWLSAIGEGLRYMNNAFLKSFSVIMENAHDAITSRTEKLLGEQSAFRRADRELHKEYFARTGRTKAMGVKKFSYQKGNTPVPVKDQGIFDFMYTWKIVAGEHMRIGAVYTEQDFKDGQITEAQWNYYREAKSVLKDVYETVYNKTAYMDKQGRPVPYHKAYQLQDINFDKFKDSFLPVLPFQSLEEIAEKNLLTGNINPIKLTKEAWESYQDRYDLAIQNEHRKNIGMPLKYMSNEFLQDDDHSFDVTKAIDVFSRHMIRKAELDDIYFIGKSTVAMLSNPEDSNYVDNNQELKLKNTVFALESYLNQHILGKRKMTTPYTKSEKFNKRADRFLDTIKSFISANAFWFAPVTGLFNGLYGLITNLKEGLIGSLSKRLYGEEHAVTLSHVFKAAGIAWKHQFANLATKRSNFARQFNEDFEGEYYKDKLNYMNKIFRLGNKNYTYTDNSLMLGQRNKLFSQGNAYLFQGLGEDLMNETLVVASLLARKVEVRSVDSQGNETVKYLKKDGTYTTNPNESGLENMWDIYKFNEESNEWEYTGPTRFIDKNGQEVKGLTTLETLRAKTYMERIYGSYSPEQRVHLERYALGRALMQFRKFQLMNIRENFTLDSHMTYVGEYQQLFNPDGTPKLKDGQPIYSWQAEAMMSRWKAFRSLVGAVYSVSNREKWEELSAENKKQAIRFATQLVFYGVTIVLGMGGLVPPEDKDKLYVKRISRLAQDLSVVDPMNIIESSTTINSYPVQLFKATSGVTKFLNSVWTDDYVESGPYKGMYKGQSTVENFIPVYRSVKQANKLFSGE